MSLGKENVTAVALLIALASIAYGLLFYDKVLDGGDEGQLVVSGKLVAEGKVLYREVKNLYSPGIFLVSALAQSLFKENALIAGRLFILLVAAAAAVLLYLIARKLVAFPYSLVPSALQIIWGIPFQHILTTSWPAVLFQILAVYFAASHIEDRRARTLFLAGLSAGAAAFFKQNVGFYTVLGISVFYLIEAIRVNGLDFRRVLRGLWSRKLFFAGVAFIPALAIAYFASSGALFDLYNSVLVRAHAAHVDACWDAPFPTPLSLLPAGFSLEGVYRAAINSVYYAVLLAYAAALWFAFSKRERLADNRNKILLVLTLVALFQYHMLVFPRTDRNHLLFSIPLAFVIAVYLLTQIKLPPGRRAAAGYIVFFALLGLALTAFNYRPYYSGAELQQKFGVVFPAEQARDFVQAADYVRINTAEGEKIFVAGGFATFYYAAGRAPASSFIQLFPGMTSPLEIQAEIIRDVEAHGVRYAVLYKLDKIDRCTFEEYGGLIAEHLRQEFAPEKEFGNFVVLKRR